MVGPDNLEWHGQGLKAPCKGPNGTKCVPKSRHGNEITEKKEVRRIMRDLIGRSQGVDDRYMNSSFII